MLPLIALLFATQTTITPVELYEQMKSGDAVVIDVRGSVPYDLGHIDGAISMPLGLIPQRVTELPQDKLIVAYCSCKREEISDQAVRELKNHGIERAAALKGGYDAWVAAKLPIVEHADPDAPPRQSRLMVPPFVTCDRNEVTAYPGEVIVYKKNLLRIKTDSGTTEEVKGGKHFAMGKPFTAADRKRAGAHKRVIAWVCRGGPVFVDWRFDEKARSGD